MRLSVWDRQIEQILKCFRGNGIYIFERHFRDCCRNMDLFRKKIHSRGRWRKLDDWRSTSWSILWRKCLIVLIRSISWNCSTRQAFLLYWKKVKNAMALGSYVFWKIDRLETGQRRFFFNFPWIFLRLEISGFTGISRIMPLKEPECYLNCLEDTEQEYFESPIVCEENTFAD